MENRPRTPWPGVGYRHLDLEGWTLDELILKCTVLLLGLFTHTFHTNKIKVRDSNDSEIYIIKCSAELW